MSLTEKELAAAGVAHMQAEKWTVSEEVLLESALRGQTTLGQGRIDIVVTRGQVLGIVEVKLGLGLELLAQLYRSTRLAHAVWGLVPESRETDARLYAFRVCRSEGFGLLEYGTDGVVERIPPRVRDSIDPELAQSLRPEHQNGQYARAGQSGAAGIYTPGNAMEAALAAYVDRCGGCTLEEAVKHIKHVFARDERAVEYLAKKIRKGAIPDVFFGWRQRLFPTKESARTGVIA